jgi:hypothetical protein
MQKRRKSFVIEITSEHLKDRRGIKAISDSAAIYGR